MRPDISALFLGIVISLSVVSSQNYYSVDPNKLQYGLQSGHEGSHLTNGGNYVQYLATDKQGGDGNADSDDSSHKGNMNDNTGSYGYGYGGYGTQHHTEHHETDMNTKLGKLGVTKILLVIFPFVVTLIFCASLVILLGILLLPVLVPNWVLADDGRSFPYEQLRIVNQSISKYE